MVRVLRGFAGDRRLRSWHFGALGERLSASCLGNGFAIMWKDSCLLVFV